MSEAKPLIIGSRNRVLAIDKETGRTLWDTKLEKRLLKVGSGFTNLFLDGDDLYAAAYGHIYRLDPRTGDVIWTSEASGSLTIEMTFATHLASNQAAWRRTDVNIS